MWVVHLVFCARYHVYLYIYICTSHYITILYVYVYIACWWRVGYGINNKPAKENGTWPHKINEPADLSPKTATPVRIWKCCATASYKYEIRWPNVASVKNEHLWHDNESADWGVPRKRTQSTARTCVSKIPYGNFIVWCGTSIHHTSPINGPCSFMFIHFPSFHQMDDSPQIIIHRIHRPFHPFSLFFINKSS